VIYFIETIGAPFLKIGFTEREPLERLGELQTSNCYPLRLLVVIAGDKRKESKLHSDFAHLKASNEWFNFTPELQTYVAMARWILPRLDEMDERLGEAIDRLNSLTEDFDDVSNKVGGQGCADEPPSWTIEIEQLRQELGIKRQTVDSDDF
jgi:hypothetical protein